MSMLRNQIMIFKYNSSLKGTLAKWLTSVEEGKIQNEPAISCFDRKSRSTHRIMGHVKKMKNPT